MNYREKLKNLFVQHLRIIYDGENVVLNALNTIATEIDSEKTKEMFVLKTQEVKKNINLLDKVFQQLNLTVEGEKDNIIRSFLNKDNHSGIDKNDLDKEVKFIFSRVLSGYFNNAYQAAADCAAELGNNATALMLMNCLKQNRVARGIISRMNESTGKSIYADTIAA